MTTKEITNELTSISSEISNLETKRNELVWSKGIPALINKMKKLGKDTIYLREAVESGYSFDEEDYFFDEEDLCGTFNGGYFAAENLKLNEDDQLIVVYNEIWEQQDSWEGERDYSNEYEMAVTRGFSDVILSKIMEVLLTKDAIFDVECSDDDEDVEDNEDD